MAKFTVLMSAHLSTLTASQNKTRTRHLAIALSKCDLEFITCVGVYKGESEISLAVPCNHKHHLSQLIELAQEFEQESILAINNETNKAVLHYVDHKVRLTQSIVELGKWTKTTWNDCKYNHDNYTYFPEANVYYVCRD
ncbi:MAG: DUF3293 domain-containing protein [Aeromonas popoffii]|uniref:DUF3293 domain-containing protein n=1 Tax=Aeromonas popoffii TaxID=70856 RepID=UPI003F2BF671